MFNINPTPGEWRVEADAANWDKHPFHRYRYVTSPDQGSVTICVMMDSHHMAHDAGLMAMAHMIPDLVEALSDAASRFPILSQTDDVRYQQIRALLDKAERRLAKIEGGS